jgi:predicted metallopeptidase
MPLCRLCVIYAEESAGEAKAAVFGIPATFGLVG